MACGSWERVEWKGIRSKVPFDWSETSHLLRQGEAIDWLHQQIKYFNKNYTLPAKCRLDIHALLGKRVSFHLNTWLNSEAKGAVSLEGEWMTVRLYTMELCSMHLLPHLHSCSPWCKWKWNSNNSEHFLDVPWEAQCYICCILSMALTLLTLRADEQQQDSRLPSSSSWPSYVCLATWRTSTIS